MVNVRMSEATRQFGTVEIVRTQDLALFGAASSDRTVDLPARRRLLVQ